MISPSQRPLPDNTQHSQQTNIHALGGIRTHTLGRRAAEDLRLRPRGHWDRRGNPIAVNNYHIISHQNTSLKKLRRLKVSLCESPSNVCSCKFPLHARFIIATDDMANLLTTRRMLTLFSYGISEFEKSVYEQLMLVSSVCYNTWKCS